MARRSHNEGSIDWWEGKGLWAAAITLPNGKRKVKTSTSKECQGLACKRAWEDPRRHLCIRRSVTEIPRTHQE